MSRNVTQVKENVCLRSIGFCWKSMGGGIIRLATKSQVTNAPDISPVFPTGNTKPAQAIVLLKLLRSVVR